jgi:hypothetical protein
MRRVFAGTACAAIAGLGLAGCATLQQIAALSSVEFALDRVSALRLAGVDLSGVRTIQDVSPIDVARVTAALATGDVPLDFMLHVRATNPESNTVDARLVALDWTLLLEDRETISGALDRGVILPPGQPVDVPLAVRLDLSDFAEGGARDLLELAISLAGAGGEPRDIALRATPTIETSLGPIRYPRPITIGVRTGD